MALAAALIVLFASAGALRLVRGKSLSFPPGAIWVGGGLLFAALSLVPLPSGLVGLVAPAVKGFYAPLRTELAVTAWHPGSIEPFQTVWSLVLLAGLASAFFLANRHLHETSARSLLAYVLAATGVALSLFAVYQKARFGTLLYGSVPVENASPFGPFVSHNHFAGFVEACALVTLGAALGSFRRHGSLALLLGGASVLIGIAHLLSHSRGGLVALGAGLVTLAWLSRKDQAPGWGWLLAGGGVAVVTFVVLFAPSSLYQRLATLGDPAADDSVQFRAQLWSDSLGMWARTPVVGTGLGTYAVAIPAYRSGPSEIRAEYAESDWLQLLCETGLVGSALAAMFLFSVLRHAGREPREGHSERHRGVTRGLLAAVVALLVHGIVDFNFHIPSNALLFAVLLGVLAPQGPRVSTKQHPFALRIGVAVLFVGVGVGLAAYAVRMGTSEELNRRVDPLLTDPGEFTERIQQLGRSRESLPSNPQTAFLLGRLYNEEAFRSREKIRYRELRLEQAGEAFRDSLRRAPARGRTWFELAWTEANLGRDDAADRLFPLALRLEPHWANLRANYALYLVSRGRIDEALDQIVAARELWPGLRPADALEIIGPYLTGRPELLRRAAGEGEDAEDALSRFLQAGES